MKNTFKILIAGLAALVASCTTTPDVEIDSVDYSRVLAPLNFTAEVVPSVGTDVAFRWSAMKNADSYTLEVYTDQAMTALVGTYPVGKDELPYTVRDLEVDTEFWARVRGESQTLTASNWTVLEEPVATFPVRPSLHPKVTDRTTASVTLSWDDVEDKDDLNSVRVERVSTAGEARSVTLDAAALEGCTVTVAGLEPATEYKFTMIFGLSGQRGSVAAWTRPDTGGTTAVSTTEALAAALQGATGEVKLLVAYNDGEPYDLATAITSTLGIGYDLYIYGEANAEGKKPVIVGLSPELNAGCTVFHLEDLVLDGAANKFSTLAENKAANLDRFEVVNCEIYDYSQRLYFANAAGTSCKSLVFDGVYAHDINATGGGGGDFIDIRKGTTDALVIRNSTFSFAARTFLRVSESGTKIGTVEVTNCTFNAVTATLTSSNNAGIFAVRKVTEPTAMTVKNCLFLNETSDGETSSTHWVKLARNSTDTYSPVFSKNYFYNVTEFTDDKGAVTAGFLVSNAEVLGVAGSKLTPELAMAEGGAMLTVDPCVNSIGGKLYLSDPTIAAGKIGDPRWWNLTQPEAPIRATELETVTENTAWDFKVKTLYDTETVTSKTIIQNIEFYATAAAPTQIVMGKGVDFPTKGAMANNAPTSGAVGFKVDKVGTVKVTATGDNATYTVHMGADSYPLKADGVAHSVVLGDIAGETMIYVVAGAPMTLTNVEWSTTLTPEPTVTALAKPVVTLDNAKVDEASEQAVTASWAAVANADSYEVTFRGAKTTQTGTTFEIPAATVAALAIGTYDVSVVARPVATSTKFSASAAGVATLTIAGKTSGGENKFWNFSDIADAATYSAETVILGDLTVIATSGSNMALSANNKSMDDYSFTKRLQFNGTMDSALPPTYRAIKFAVTGPCKITVYGMSGSGNNVRKLKISDGTAILTDSFLENDGNALGKGEYNYTGGAGNIYIGSAGSGYNIYAVGVEY